MSEDHIGSKFDFDELIAEAYEKLVHENATLQQQLDKAVECLERLDDLLHPCCVDDDMDTAYYTLKQTLKQIKGE